MVSKERYIGQGLDQDTAPNKRQPDTYWDAKNIRIINNGRNLSIKPLKSATSIVTIPSTSGTQYLIGKIELNNFMYLFLSNNNTTPNGSSTDSIYRLDTSNNLVEVAQGNYYLSSLNLIQGLGNHENENIIKLYWVDGYNQLRSINVAQSLPITVTAEGLDIVKEITYVKPVAVIQLNGSLLAGKIQYGYNLFKLNGSETKISPLSDLQSISIDSRGGDSGEIMSLSCTVNISDIDQTFEYIRIYSIHYQELNQLPKITLIIEREITGTTSLNIVDDGNLFIAEYGIDQFLFLGGDPIIPKTLTSKYNHLFMANYKSIAFDVNVDTYLLDCRVYSFPNTSTTFYLKEVGGGATAYTSFDPSSGGPSLTADSINPDYDTYSYKRNSSVYGATGQNFNVAFTRNTSVNYDGTDPISLKQGEIYRIGVIFFNKYGQKSTVKWMGDFKTPRAVDTRGINSLFVSMTALGVTNFGAAGVTHYQIVSVKRNTWDRTIISQGFVVPSIEFKYTDLTSASPYHHPHYITQDIRRDTIDQGANIKKSFEAGVDWHSYATPQNDIIIPAADNQIQFFYSTDTIFENSLDSPSEARLLGTAISPSTKNNSRATKWYQGVPEFRTVYGTYVTGGFTPTVEPAFPECILESSTYASFDFHLEYEHISTRVYDYSRIYSTDTEVIDYAKFYNSGEIKSLGSGDIISNYTNMPEIIYNKVGGTGINTGLISEYCGAMVLKFNVANWHSTGGNDFGKFTDVTTIATIDRELPIIELTRILTNQYGGGSYEVKQTNEYLVTGEIVPLGTSSITHYIGDIFVGPLRVNRSNGGANRVKFQWDIYELIEISILENNHDVFSLNSELVNWAPAIDASTEYRNFTIGNNHKLLSAYNQEPTLVTYYPKSATFQEVTEYVNRVTASALKISGEVIDSWAKILINEVLDVDGSFGEIITLYNFKNEVLSFQPYGVSQLSILPRIQTTGNDGVGIELGKGDLFYDHKYLVTKSGIIDRFGVIDDGNILMFYDSSKDAINTLDGQKVSTTLGVSTILKENNSKFVNTVYNNYTDEFLFIFDDYSLAYSLLTNKFFAKLYYNKNVFAFNQGIYSLDFSSLQVNKNESAVNTYMASEITYMFAPAPNLEKVFHNLEYRLYGTDFNQVQVDDIRNTSGLVNTDIKVKFDLHRMHLPRIEDTRERFRGIYTLVNLKQAGGLNTDYSLDDMVLMFNLKG